MKKNLSYLYLFSIFVISEKISETLTNLDSLPIRTIISSKTLSLTFH